MLTNSNSSSALIKISNYEERLRVASATIEQLRCEIKDLRACVGIAPRSVPKVSLIKFIVAREFGESDELIFKSQRRNHYLVWPRHVAMYLCCEILGMSSSMAAREFNRTDHGTVLNACNRVRCRMETEVRVREQMLRLTDLVKNGITNGATTTTTQPPTTTTRPVSHCLAKQSDRDQRNRPQAIQP